MTGPVRVLCVDDHRVVRSGLAAMLALEPDFAPADLAANGAEARALAAARRPDVALLDLRLRGEDGVELARQLLALSPAMEIVIMTSYSGDEPVHRAIEAGLHGYLLKDWLDLKLVAAIRSVLAGRRYVQPEVARQLAESGPRVVLTPREREVLALLAEGLRTKEIAVRLGVGEATARTHVDAIIGKFGTREPTAAVAQAARRGFLHWS